MKKIGIKTYMSADTSQFRREMKRSQGYVSKFTKQANRMGGMIAGAFAVGAVTNFFRTSMQGYDKQAKAEAGLLTALKGRMDIQQRLIAQSQSLQRKTVWGDEQSIEAAARLASIIGDNEQALKKLLPLVQDFATSKGMDLSAAAELIGKTVGSSTNALSRYGLVIEGNVGSAERLESAVSALNKQVGGQAEAAAKAGIGALQQLSNQWGDLKEKAGKFLSGNLDLGELNDLMTVINSGKFTKWQILKTAFDFSGKKIHQMAQDVEKMDSIKLLSLSETMERYKNATSEAEKSALRQHIIEVQQARKGEGEAVKTVIPLYEELNNKLKELKELKMAATTRAEIAAINDKEKAIQKEIKALNELSNVQSARTPAPAKLTGSYGASSVGETSFAVPGLADVGPSLQANIDLAKNMAETGMMELGGVITDGLNNAIGQIAEGVGRMVSGDIGMQQFFDGLLGMFGSFIKQMGGLIMAYGIGMISFKKAFSNPVAAIAAGAGMIAIGSMITGLANRGPGAGISGAAGGGYSGGGTMGYVDNRNSGLQVEVSGVLKGEDIYLSNKKQADRLGRF